MVRQFSVLLLALGLGAVSFDAAAAKSCLANVSSTTSLDQSIFSYTWTPIPDAARTGAGDRLQAFLAGGAKISEVQKGGARRQVTLSVPFEGWQHAVVHVGVDEALGIAWVDARRSKSDYAGPKFQYVMCSMLEVVFPSGDGFLARKPLRSDKEHQRLADELAAQHREDEAWLSARMRSAGQAIVITPIPDSGNQYGFVNPRKSPDAWTDATSFTHWVSDSSVPLVVGERTAPSEVGFGGYLYTISTGKRRYMAYAVQPGHYRIGRLTAEMANRVMPNVEVGALHGPASVGTAYFEQQKYDEFYHTADWHDAKFEDRTIVQSYCAMIVEGPCVQWGQNRQTVQEMVEAAGFKDTIHSRDADMVRVDATIGQPTASFDVGPGEVVLVDGFYAQQPSLEFDDHRCVSERDGVRCDVTEVALVRIGAEPADLQSARAEKTITADPTLQAIVKAAVYRPVAVSMTGGSLLPGIGRIYSLRAERAPARR